MSPDVNPLTRHTGMKTRVNRGVFVLFMNDRNCCLASPKGHVHRLRHAGDFIRHNLQEANFEIVTVNHSSLLPPEPTSRLNKSAIH